MVQRYSANPYDTYKDDTGNLVSYPDYQDLEVMLLDYERIKIELEELEQKYKELEIENNVLIEINELLIEKARA